jgi:hypothetical protein
VKLLLDRGADPRLHDDRGMTALGMAREGRHEKTLAALLAADATE